MTYKYVLKNGATITSKLPAKEISKRLGRLNILRILIEQHESKDGKSIYQKTIKAMDKADNFTGIIRLTIAEKDLLGYMLENTMLDKEEVETINHYIN